MNAIKRNGQVSRRCHSSSIAVNLVTTLNDFPEIRCLAGSRLETWNGEPIPYRERVEGLRSRVRTSGREAGPAIRALVEHPEPEALASLVELTRSPDPYLRRAALEAIGDHCSGHGASDVVESMLKDSIGFVVRTACDVAATMGVAGAHDRILELIAATEEATRLSALTALEHLWVSSDFEKVFTRYLEDRSDRVRKQAAWTVNKNIGPEHWKQVFERWSRDPLPRHRVWACAIAERFGTERSLRA